MPDDVTPARSVSAHLDLSVAETSEILLSIAVAKGHDVTEEHLSLQLNGSPMAYEEFESVHGTRLHLSSGIPAGNLVVEYRATVRGPADPPPHTPLDRFTYLRPSRYADSDTMFAVAQSEFAGLTGKELLDAVSSWVGSQLQYVAGSSRPIDGAVDTYLARQGVCRDYAHLVIALLRAMNVPARLVSVYAPGLSPMDFHAVAEAYVDGAWNVVDATLLAPRQTLVRIATGQDAADTAFLSVLGGSVLPNQITVTAEAAPDLPNDDITQLVALM